MSDSDFCTGVAVITGRMLQSGNCRYCFYLEAENSILHPVGKNYALD